MSRRINDRVLETGRLDGAPAAHRLGGGVLEALADSISLEVLVGHSWREALAGASRKVSGPTHHRPPLPGRSRSASVNAFSTASSTARPSSVIRRHFPRRSAIVSVPRTR